MPQAKLNNKVYLLLWTIPSDWEMWLHYLLYRNQHRVNQQILQQKFRRPEGSWYMLKKCWKRKTSNQNSTWRDCPSELKEKWRVLLCFLKNVFILEREKEKACMGEGQWERGKKPTLSESRAWSAEPNAGLGLNHMTPRPWPELKPRLASQSIEPPRHPEDFSRQAKTKETQYWHYKKC